MFELHFTQFFTHNIQLINKIPIFVSMKLRLFILCWLLFPCFVHAQIITTVAGTGIQGYSGDSGLAVNAEFNVPNSVSVDIVGNLYMTDCLNNRIRKVNYSTGIITTIAGTGVPGYNGDGVLATTAQLNSPCIGDMDNCGNIFIADAQNGRVRKVWFNTDSTYTASIAISPNDTVSIGTTTTYTATTSSTMAMPTYQWVKNGVHVGSNSKYYTDTAANGDNVYCIVTARTCSGVLLTDTTNIIHAVVVPDGVSNVTNNAGYMVYPNPATNTLHIDKVTTPTTYKLKDIQGAEKQRGVLCKGANTVSLQGLASGVYVLELVLENETKIVKIVKE